MINSRAQFVLEDYCHIPHVKRYWCRSDEEGMVAHEYIIYEKNEDDILIPMNIYDFTFGLRFPLHPFFSQILCHYRISLKQLTQPGNQEDTILHLDQ